MSTETSQNPREKQFKAMLELLGTSMTREEFLSAFKEVVAYVKNIDIKTENAIHNEFKTISESVKTAVSRMENENKGNVTQELETAKTELENNMNKMLLEHEAMMSEATSKIDSIKNGENGKDGQGIDEQAVVQQIISLMPIPEEETPEEIRDMLETLEGNERLDISAIKGVDELKDQMKVTQTVTGGARGMFLYINGVKQGIVSMMNIVGTGVATSVVGGLLTITITGGSGGSSIETPTGTVDGSNLIFTVTQTPLYTIVDGISKFSGVHYSYSAGTITLFADNAPTQYIKTVY